MTAHPAAVDVRAVEIADFYKFDLPHIELASSETTPEAHEAVFGEAAAPDVPAALGWLIVGVFGLILLAYGLFFATTADVTFNLGVCGVYLAVYLGVPAVLLRMERPTKRIDLFDFLACGLDTWTGHVGGATALVQILFLPFAIALAATGVGLVYRLVG